MSHQDALSEALFVDRGGFELQDATSPFVAMQRVVVRMLFDPAFVSRVYEDPGAALADLDLDPALVAQLTTNDRRLWSADRLRRSRALKILLEEFKVSSTLVLLERRRQAFLYEFFSSPGFHDAVQRRGYMAIAFAQYLEQAARDQKITSPHALHALHMEAAMARSRRLLRDALRGVDPSLEPMKADAITPGPALLTHPGVLALSAPSGLIGLVNHIEKYLFEVSQVPALVLCDDPPSPEPLPPLDVETPCGFLLEPQVGGKVELSQVDPSFVPLIAACARPTRPEIIAVRVNEPVDDVADLTAQLVEGGVLRVVNVDADGSVRPVEAAPRYEPSLPLPAPKPRSGGSGQGRSLGRGAKKKKKEAPSVKPASQSHPRHGDPRRASGSGLNATDERIGS